MPDPRQPDVITVAVTRADGGLTVMRVITTEYQPDGDGVRVAAWTIDPTDDYIEAIIAKHAWSGPQAAVSWRRVPNSFVDESTDRTFRNAWRDAKKGKPEVDMSKARDIHRDRLRALRQPLLEALDAEYLRADEEGDTAKKAATVKRKQALRDLPANPAIEAAKTPDKLKAILPDG
jgi:hypothetical protein